MSLFKKLKSTEIPLPTLGTHVSPAKSEIAAFPWGDGAMTETRQIVGHSRHTLPGPHADLPVGFVPLRLCVAAENLHIDVTVPVVIVGRHSDADLRFAFPEVSRRHCRLAFDDGQSRISDL